MFLEYTPEQQALSRELRAYFRDLMGDDVVGIVQERGENNPRFREVVRRIGRDGWLGIGWPTEYGGQGRPVTDQFIFFDEVWRAQAPFPFVTLNTVGPTLMAYGTPEQKERYLPGILTGDVIFAIGYTEPEAGTDLASLRTRAVLDGDEWVINGNKVFTSGANHADYIWLACRTDPDVPKHKGISIFLVPRQTPGVKIEPIRNFGGLNTNITYYEDVRVPVGNLVGEENRGWSLIVNQLNHERVTLCSSGIVERQLDDVLEWARTTHLADGRRVVDQEWVQLNLARVHAKLEFLRMQNWKIAYDATLGTPLNPADASVTKVFGTELYMEAFRLLMEVIGPRSTVAEGSPGAVVHGRLERLLRTMHILTFGGGVNEMQRDLIAVFGLGMPGTAR